MRMSGAALVCLTPLLHAFFCCSLGLQMSLTIVCPPFFFASFFLFFLLHSFPSETSLWLRGPPVLYCTGLHDDQSPGKNPPQQPLICRSDGGAHWKSSSHKCVLYARPCPVYSDTKPAAAGSSRVRLRTSFWKQQQNFKSVTQRSSVTQEERKKRRGGGGGS